MTFMVERSLSHSPLVPNPNGANFSLNCLVLGDDPRRIFTIKVASTENVSAFRRLVWDEQKHAFDGVDANRLHLWDVSVLMPTFECW
jgi:hypothetical protein